MTDTASTTLSRDLTGDYTIDPAHTRLGFVARHAMVTKVRGQFTSFEGTIHADAEEPSRSSVSVTIDVASVDTGNEMRDNHLRTNDFFDIEHYPTITFTSTAIRQTAPTTFEVTGDLTIRGVTRSVTFELELTGAVKDPFGNDRIGFEGSLVVNRKDFGVNWNAPLEAGGVLVSEKVTLELDVAAIRAKAEQAESA
ncbi:MAG TPA: YceI family protein [Acidimicrobiales bacterium]|nr:YceI family protein [Acidimicrobiales bacterium]